MVVDSFERLTGTLRSMTLRDNVQLRVIAARRRDVAGRRGALSAPPLLSPNASTRKLRNLVPRDG